MTLPRRFNGDPQRYQTAASPEPWRLGPPGIRANRNLARAVFAMAVLFGANRVAPHWFFNDGTRIRSCLFAQDALTASARAPEQRPFLDVFRSANRVRIKTQSVEWPSAIGRHVGLLVRPDTNDRLPALVVLEQQTPRQAFSKRVARDLARVGYVVLVVTPGEDRGAGAPAAKTRAMSSQRRLVPLSAAVRWLRRRDDVFPDRVGAFGWSRGARWALELSAAKGLQACVLVDAEVPLSLEPALTSQLRRTALMSVRGTDAATFLDTEKTARFRRLLQGADVELHVLEFEQAKPGFLDSSRKDTFNFAAAERAWFEMYEFLGAHVEDAARQLAVVTVSQPAAGQVASISDLMRTVNAPSGMRGQLALALSGEPKDPRQWKTIRAEAALLAETGALLQVRAPSKGSPASWRRHTTAYREAAVSLVAAADRRDYAAARKALAQLNGSCSACHLQHR